MKAKYLTNIIFQAVSKPAHPLFMVFFRITFGVMGILFALRVTSQFEFIWPSNVVSPRFIPIFLHGLWITLLVLITLGYERHPIKLLHFVCASYILNTRHATFSVDDLFFLLGAFWIIFMPTNYALAIWKRNCSNPPPAWPAFLMGVVAGCYLLTAGIAKMLDPVWVSGYGLYYTFLLPWIKPASVSALLDRHSVLVFLNYFAMLFEISFIFLFFFRKTRLIAVLLYTGMIVHLVYPLRIDFIGLLGLPLLIPLFGTSLGFFREKVSSRKVGRSEPYCFSVLSIFICFYLFESLIVPFQQGYPMTFPPVAYFGFGEAAFEQQIEEGEGDADNPNKTRLLSLSDQLALGVENFRQGFLRQVNAKIFRIFHYPLFNSQHFLGIYLYQIKAVLSNGSELDTLKVFNADLTAGPASGSLGANRVLQNEIYNISRVCHRLLEKPDYLMSGFERSRLLSLLHFATLRLSSKELEQLEYLSLRVRPVVMPETYQGDVKLWEDVPWRELFHYDHVSHTVEQVNPPQRVDWKIKTSYPQGSWVGVRAFE